MGWCSECRDLGDTHICTECVEEELDRAREDALREAEYLATNHGAHGTAAAIRRLRTTHPTPGETDDG